MHSTTLLPRTLWQESPDTPRGDLDPRELADGEEELEPPTTQQMAHPGMWVHACSNILINCLVEHKEAEAPADQEEEFDQDAANLEL